MTNVKTFVVGFALAFILLAMLMVWGEFVLLAIAVPVVIAHYEPVAFVGLVGSTFLLAGAVAVLFVRNE